MGDHNLRPALRHARPTPGQRPRIIAEDADLIVVDKPAGWLTHDDGQSDRPNVVGWIAGPVGVHQRLDVDTTGVLAFSRSSAGRRLLSDAFEAGGATKIYLAVVEGPSEAESPGRGWARQQIAGDVPAARGKRARTRFSIVAEAATWALIEARPETGRTHQIRAHLASVGRPVRGDALYGDPIDLRAPRCLLHCRALELPNGRRFEAPLPSDMVRYAGGAPSASRADLRSDPDTTCFRELHGGADGTPGWWVDRYGDWVWAQHDFDAPPGPMPEARGAYLLRSGRDRSHGALPESELIGGTAPPSPLEVREHGTRYLVELGGQRSTGMFLDHRPQRSWLAGHAQGMRVLNAFAHAGAFSVAAARAGARTVSVDLSARWLERIPPQLQLNGLNPDDHVRIAGDVFDWLGRFAKRGERFDLVILDPPSTSVARRRRRARRWSAAQDYPLLAAMASELVEPGGQLWTATNLRKLDPVRFARLVRRGLPESARLMRVCPPAVDHPTDGPAAMKCLVWQI